MSGPLRRRAMPWLFLTTGAACSRNLPTTGRSAPTTSTSRPLTAPTHPPASSPPHLSEQALAMELVQRGAVDIECTDTNTYIPVSDGTRVDSNTIAASYDDPIRPLLDAVAWLRHLKEMREGIQLPTIAVVGDQSSVLESLTGIILSRGQGICTRVPLVLLLQDDPSTDSPKLQLEYNNGCAETSTKANVAEVSAIYRGHSSSLPSEVPAYKVDVMNQCLGDLDGVSVVQEAPEVFEEMAKHITEIL